jgi:hypothetical protein
VAASVSSAAGAADREAAVDLEKSL